jgi:hypothetical protein
VEALTGSIQGSSGGGFAYYTIDNPSGSAITCSVTFAPFNVGDAHRLGLIVWQNGTSLGTAKATATGLKDKTTSNTATLTITPASGVPALIQIFNYTADDVSYSLSITGATAQAMPPTAPTVSSPQTLSGATTSGALTGNSGGAFNRYTVNPSATTMTFTLDYSPYTPGTAHQIGIQVWQNGSMLGKAAGTATGLKDKTSSNVASVTVTVTMGEPVTLAVFNYSSTTITYTLST